MVPPITQKKKSKPILKNINGSNLYHIKEIWEKHMHFRREKKLQKEISL